MHHLLNEWADFLTATGRRPATVRTRMNALGSLLTHSGVEPLDLRRRHVLAWLAGTRTQWTRVTYWSSAAAFDAWLVEFDHADLGLVRGIPKPKQPASVARPVSSDTVRALLDAPLSGRAGAYVRLALYQALRIHEIAKIAAEDFDWSEGWLTVDGKGGYVERIPIHDEIRNMSARMPEMSWWFPSSVPGNEHVTGHAVGLTVAAALRSVGSTATAHQLRDTAATEFQRRVRDIRLTQSFLRHRSVVSTQKYTKVDAQALKDAVLATRWDAAA